MSEKVVLTGGGSGGHITPILAVAAELKQRDPKTHIIYVGQRGDSLGDIPAADPNIDETYTVRAGKFRRYHGEGFLQWLNPHILFLNIRDFFFVLVGIYQSWRLMGQLRPDVVFSRGGFVSVPVCLGAAMRHIGYITHDSDPIPSLANRIIARWARVHAVALPTDIYPYKQSKTVTTGIPLNKEFKPVTDSAKHHYLSELKLPKHAKLLFIIGGGLGSQRVNHAVADALPHLLSDFPELHVVHVVGRANKEEMRQAYIKELPDEPESRVQILDFIPDVYRYSGAADIVITRAGATNLAEFALQGKACIVIPSSFLASGHQLRNAEYLEEQGAALVITEDDLADDPNRLAKQVAELMHNPQHITKLEKALAAFGQPNATRDIATIILEQAHASEA